MNLNRGARKVPRALKQLCNLFLNLVLLNFLRQAVYAIHPKKCYTT